MISTVEQSIIGLQVEITGYTSQKKEYSGLIQFSNKMRSPLVNFNVFFTGFWPSFFPINRPSALLIKTPNIYQEYRDHILLLLLRPVSSFH